MASRQTTIAISLAGLAGFCFASGAFAQDRELIAINAPVRAAQDPAVQQAVDLLSKNPKKAGETKGGTIFHSKPADDTTVVRHRKDSDKILILGGAEVLPM